MASVCRYSVCCVLLVFLFLVKYSELVLPEALDVERVEQSVARWSEQIGQKLHSLSMTMTRKKEITQNFKDLGQKIYSENGETIIKNLARDMRNFMVKKEQAVKRIADYAEFLAYHQLTDPIDPIKNGTFQYYNQTILDTKYDVQQEKELENYVNEAECEWWCVQKELTPLTNNIFNKAAINRLFEPGSDNLQNFECDCNSLPDRVKEQKYFHVLPLKNSSQYGFEVNLNLSIVKVATNVYYRASEAPNFPILNKAFVMSLPVKAYQNVMQGVRWSEPLDVVFKDNLRRDSTLKYQYFASPSGFMRHFPAVLWSTEPYDLTYDFRIRSWYTEAMTSPKDILILLDISGSMHGKSKTLAHQVVNEILDTLNDNDYVNIYLFQNKTFPLVECFEDILVEANEENLRLLRESLSLYKEEFVGDLMLGVDKAFTILAEFKRDSISSQCNQALMIITDDDNDYAYKPEWFEELNRFYDTSVRVFTYIMGIEDDRCAQMEWIACTNRGYFVNVSVQSEVREKVLNYLNVMSRPINENPMNKQVPIWSYLQIDLADRRYSNWLWKKFEGNRQRAVFLDHVKRMYQRLGQVLTSEKHILLTETHVRNIDVKLGNKQSVNTGFAFSKFFSDSLKFDISVGTPGAEPPLKLVHRAVGS